MNDRSRKRRILLWHPTLYPFAYSLARAVAEQEWEPEVWTFLPGGRYGCYEGYDSGRDVIVRTFEDPNPLERRRRLAAALRDTHFDAAMVKDPEWTESLIVARTLRRKGVPRVVGLSENRVLHNRKNLGLYLLSRAKKKFMRREIDRAIRVFCETERSVGYARMLGCRTQRVEVRPHPIDIERFRPPTSGERDESRRRFGLDPAEERMVVLYVGGFFVHKGIDLVQSCAERAEESSSPLVFLIPAFGDLLEERRAAMSRLGSVRLIDKVPHESMPDLHRACDAFLIPAVRTRGQEERSPNALLEAMASGLACLGTDIGGIRSYMGGAGVAVPEEDAEALWKVLDAWARDRGEMRRWARKARETAERRNDPRSYARYLLGIFEGDPADSGGRS